jgi:hypothetical protein
VTARVQSEFLKEPQVCRLQVWLDPRLASYAYR